MLPRIRSLSLMMLINLALTSTAISPHSRDVSGNSTISGIGDVFQVEAEKHENPNVRVALQSMILKVQHETDFRSQDKNHRKSFPPMSYAFDNASQTGQNNHVREFDNLLQFQRVANQTIIRAIVNN